MEALTLLRYWRSNAAEETTNAADGTTNANVTTSTTIFTAVSTQPSETGDEEVDENDHGPFFDLEFSLPAEGDEAERENNGEVDEDEVSGGSDESENEMEMNFTLMSGSSGDSVTTDVNVALSPSDELFFNGGYVPVDQTTTEITSKPPQFRLALMKSATKFRVMMLKFRKSKLNAESNGSTDSGKSNASSCSNSKEEDKRKAESTDSGKSMTVRFNVEEEVPIISLFKRHNSSKGSTEEKKFSKETMQKYFRKVSQKYGDKLKLAKPNLAPSSPSTNPRREKEGNLPAGLGVVCKHLGKTWSTSAAIASADAATEIPSKRRDDSLIQQQDGIQSAILHCKRSFKASRDCDV